MSDADGPQLGKFVGFEQPQTLILRTLERAALSATRLRGSFVSGTPVRLDRNNGYLLCLQRRPLLAPSYWVDGRAVPLQPIRGGQFLLLDLDREHTSVSYGEVEVGLDDLAAACELSRSHFARAFKVTTGASPFQWLLAQRIERAQNLLLNSKLPMDQIAAQCGFADQSHFTRTFLKFVNESPGRWRRLRRL